MEEWSKFIEFMKIRNRLPTVNDEEQTIMRYVLGTLPKSSVVMVTIK